MKRRTAIKLGILSVIAVGATAATYSMFRSFDSLIFSVLQSDLKDLKLHEADLRKYAQEAASLNPFNFSPSKVKLISLYNELQRIGIKTGPYYNKYIQYRSEIVGNFLLSTDFFWSRLNVNDEIKYSGRIFTPYDYPCGNPFSNRYYS